MNKIIIKERVYGNDSITLQRNMEDSVRTLIKAP